MRKKIVGISIFMNTDVLTQTKWKTWGNSLAIKPQNK